MKKFFVIGFSFFVFGAAAIAQENTASLSLQVAVCKQIFRYDRALTKKDTIKVAVVYSNDADMKSVVKLVDEFQTTDPMVILSKPISESDLRDVVFTYDAVYFYKVSQPQAAHDWTARSGALSLTDSEKFVKAAHSTVCVTVTGGKPLILINRASAKQEKREFFGEILTLAKLID